MDPLSEMQALEAFEECGLIAVGWYHSHPSFAPIPSITDIHNQANFQVKKNFFYFSALLHNN